MTQRYNSIIDPWNIIASFTVTGDKRVHYYSLPALEKAHVGTISALPFSLRIVLESLVRNMDGKAITEEDVRTLANWDAKNPSDRDIPFKVSRILMQDFTGVPAVVDLAVLRDYAEKYGKPAEAVEPLMNVDLIIDHSVQVDAFRNSNALEINQEKEIERNKERYLLLKWASQAFDNFRVFPPSAGICHQVNLEYLATCVTVRQEDDRLFAFPDTLVGTDSHTTMIDALGIVGFGVGGIEAEAALLNQPVSFTTPKVIGVHLTGSLQEGITAMDLALTLTKLLRETGVVDAFVEFYGPGVKELSLPDRATVSNMCPEYGATISIFPVDEETLAYLRSTGRSEEQVDLVRSYYQAQEMFPFDYEKIKYSSIIEINLATIVPTVSGPSNPKQAVALEEISRTFLDAFLSEAQDRTHIDPHDEIRLGSESLVKEIQRAKLTLERSRIKTVSLHFDDGYETTLSDGDVVIAAITSCTNTSNPEAMIAAGLLARKAIEHGLKVEKKVKTSLAPGSRVVMDYFEKANLIEPLAALGFSLVGYGCTTCIGNSGPLPEPVSKAIQEHAIAVASVLSGNRNYESRIHSEVKGNYLMSPPLVVAFAIAGTVVKDLTKEPLGIGANGKLIFLKDIWPTHAEIHAVIKETMSPATFHEKYKNDLHDVNKYWNQLASPTGTLYNWDPHSTYIKSPPFLSSFESSEEHTVNDILNARVLAQFGDSISTDHISPAGAISVNSPAGIYLVEKGVKPEDFNTYGSRRGNDEVMARGTFANNRIKNLMVPGTEGGFTLHYPGGNTMTIYDAAMLYKKEGIPLVIIVGSEYGSGSSRDWAAKGPLLLGVKAIIAKSFERIHRSNLIGMGIIPLQFGSGEDAVSLAIDCSKEISIFLPATMHPRQEIKILYTRNGMTSPSEAILKSRIDAPIELEYYRIGGVLNYVRKGSRL